MLDDLALAQQAALAGAAVGLRYFDRVRTLTQQQKADGSVVTEADLAVEEEVRRVLLAERPDDAFLGEETGERGAGRRRWILDGIDGTLVFVQGDDRWQSLIALEEDGCVVVGVAIVPAQRRIWYAVRGQGAFIADVEDGRPVRERSLRVGESPSTLAECTVGVLPPLDLIPVALRAQVDRLTDKAVVADWSVHAGLLVASGELDLAVQVGGKVWDYAPLSLIVEEAGGSFSGDRGQSHPVTGTAVFAGSVDTLTAARAALGGC
ncbi:inositol monophosphatase family protein [Streptomyces sp. NPDC021020]|uniref:inositol monophosphatase family protein n=1 Tax=Streptomyces sp. NPDC021020 TaxID=3365109 RepID=UPI0037ABF117